MKIGQIITEYIPQENAPAKRNIYLIIRPPFMESATMMVVPNTKKNPNEPDFSIFWNFSRKGEKYKSTKVGAMWNKIGQQNGTPYKDGYIESPAINGGKLYITVFEARSEEGEELTYSHDVMWNPPKNNSGSSQNDFAYNDGAYRAPSRPLVVQRDADGNEVEIPEDQIPF